MKKNLRKGFSLFAAASVVLVGCKSTDWSKVTYTVTPSPLEMHGDSVAITVKGNIPEKAYGPKNTVVLMPTIKWNGGEKALKTITFDGEKVKEGTGVKVVRDKGYDFTITDKVAYEEGMSVSELGGKAVISKKSKSKDFPLPKLADGTIITSKLVMSDEKPILGKDNFQKIVPVSKEADINFLMSQSEVRGAEWKAEDMKAMVDFLKNGIAKGFEFKGISVSSYASPDGEQNKNADLAADRGKSSEKALTSYFKKNKLNAVIERTDTMFSEDPKNPGKQVAKVSKSDAANFYSQTSTPEDWEGFQALMQASNVPDKDMILRILSTYSDLDKREEEIKNISKAYTEIAEDILPQLRKSKITLNANMMGKSDAVLTQMSAATPDSLTIEELLYAATLSNDINTKLGIFTNAARIYPNDWRGHNNMGYVYVLQNKMAEAEAAFTKAAGASANNPVVENNLGIISIKKGDRKAAEGHYAAASTAGPEASYNMGAINIMNGKYSQAVSNYGSENTFNAALAKVLSGDNNGSMSTLEASKDNTTGMGYYLKAIISARKNDASATVNNLKSAFDKDASLKAKAAMDREFLKFKENADFKAAIM
jgi:tetratricopeptide (TPR) repeat protein